MSEPADFSRRAEAAFLGLAIGDAYGRPLEFVGGDDVRTEPVDTGSGTFRWTDDTHMAMYLAKAVLDLPPGPIDEETFGHVVGKRFVEWLHDPLTPTTAPGLTCTSGARAYESKRDWRTSGNPESDGCGAVMRICPLPIALDGDDLMMAAVVSALITHAHPNAVAAAMAGCDLLRSTLRTGRFDREQVRQTARKVRHTATVADALDAAVRFSERQQPQWLDEAAIPPGDGGWRSPSALGLAVGAVLTWGSDFRTMVDKAARIHGDSDSVACLAGMFAAAAGGTETLPGDWLASLPAREEIRELARRLVAWRRE